MSTSIRDSLEREQLRLAELQEVAGSLERTGDFNDQIAATDEEIARVRANIARYQWLVSNDMRVDSHVGVNSTSGERVRFGVVVDSALIDEAEKTGEWDVVCTRYSPLGEVLSDVASPSFMYYGDSYNRA